MKYEEISEDVRPWLGVEQEYFDSQPEIVQSALVLQARERWIREGTPRRLSLRFPIEGPLEEITDVEDRLNAFFEKMTTTSHMGIVEHRFYLKDPEKIPNVEEYVQMVVHASRSLGATNVNLSYVDNDNLPQFLSFSRRDLRTHRVDELLRMLVSGSEEWAEDFYSGSDRVVSGLKTYRLSMKQFTVMVSHVEGGYGKMIPDYYEVKGLENNNPADDDCLLQCFLYINSLFVSPEIKMCDLRKILDKTGKLGLDAVEYLEKHFGFVVDVLLDQRDIEIQHSRNIGTGVTLVDSYVATVVKDSPVVAHGSGRNKHQLLYKDNHFDVITKHYPASQCHCPHTGEFVGYRSHFGKRRLLMELKKKYGHDEENITTYDGSDNEHMEDEYYYYFFDYETVFDAETLNLRPYAFAVVKCDNHFKILETVSSIGLGCEEELAKYLYKEKAGDGDKKYLIGYNNSRFDNFLLLRHCLENNNHVGPVRFAGNTIISATVCGFTVRDLCRILNMSLDSACKAFKVSMAKHTDMLAHHDVQFAYLYNDEQGFKHYLERNCGTITKYVVRDCESLSELYAMAQTNIARLVGLDIQQHYTLPGISYRAFNKMIKHTHPGVMLPVLSEKYDKFVRKAIIGGRAQMRLSRHGSPDMLSIDCVSLYPYVMLNREFPIGLPHETKNYKIGKIGVYNVTVEQPPNKYNVIPHRDPASGRLDWCHRRPIECILTSVDIECVRRHGGVVKVVDGIYWDRCDNRLFDQYFKPLIAEKQKQDLLHSSTRKCADGTLEKEKYNPAIREICKLLMNSLSGKLAQRVYDTEFELVCNAGHIDRFYNRTIPGTQKFARLGTAFIASGKKHTVPSMPCIYGVLIYAYARTHMYDNILAHLDPGSERSEPELYGMDTDSAFISEECFQRLDPRIMGNDFGQFKVELQNCSGIFIAPKCYAFHRGEEIVKARFKGVRIGKDIDVTGLKLNTKDPISLYKMYYRQSNTKVGLSTFKRLYTTRKCTILNNNIMKGVMPANHKSTVALYLSNHIFVKDIHVNEDDPHHPELVTDVVGKDDNIVVFGD